jgi:hypothetical protein
LGHHDHLIALGVCKKSKQMVREVFIRNTKP